ncbi:MAG: hypothetical protein SVV03_01105 [Candidatus Nanohaloarchaea archaeon]|nr:hypothetical protein [Candidatus Nanohaloarchaea archaeon]
MEETEIAFKAYVKKASSGGTGFIAIPDYLSTDFDVGDSVRVVIEYGGGVEYYTNLREWRGRGVYVPKDIANRHQMCQNTYKVRIHLVEGFHAKVGGDGRVYLPNKKAAQLDLRYKIVKVESEIEGETETVYKPVTFRDRGNTEEYKIAFNCEYAGKEGLFRIKEVFEPSTEREELNQDMLDVLESFDWIVCGDTVRVFDGNKASVAMAKDLDLEDLSYYLGAYFADGTKRGNSWGIVASTFAQARFYKSCHFNIFRDIDINTDLTYTFHPSTRIDKEALKEKWKDEAGVEVRSVQEIETETEGARNRNKHGALYFREHKGLVRDIYTRMLSVLVERVVEERNEDMAWDFILGVMEGDGAPESSSRGCIQISTNFEELDMLVNIFKVLGLKHEGYEEESNNYSLRVGSLELICNLSYIGDRLFNLYPKRRRRTIKRLLDTGAARYILGRQQTTAGWVKARLNEEGILDNDYKLTKKGLKVRKTLKEMCEERGNVSNTG